MKKNQDLNTVMHSMRYNCFIQQITEEFTSKYIIDYLFEHIVFSFVMQSYFIKSILEHFIENIKFPKVCNNCFMFQISFMEIADYY